MAMRRQVCWVERLEDGVKREIRVSFLSGRRIRWQYKRSDCERWEYDTPPLPQDWQELETRVENRYRRRTASILELELVRTLRRQAAP